METQHQKRVCVVKRLIFRINIFQNPVAQPCMNEQLFLQTIHAKSKELGINSLLLLSGIEGLYTFRDVET